MVGNTTEIKRGHERHIIEHLKISGITHFYSSEFYGDHMSIALDAINRLVNPSRNVIPVSGTKIRENPFLYREYISPIVYQDLITNVVFLGAPSTGKTTIALMKVGGKAQLIIPLTLPTANAAQAESSRPTRR